MKQAIQKLLITVNEVIQFMRQGKNHMKVGGINDFGPAFIHPDFLQHRLTVRTAAVTTGIVVKFHVSTVSTLT